MAELITQAEYARRRSVSREAVSKAVRSGRISLIGKLLDPKVADLQWEANTDRAQAARANGGKLREKSADDAALATAAASGDVKANEYMQWKALHEKEAALTAQMERHRKSGLLYDKDGVDRAARTAGRLLRDQIMGVPPRVAAELCNITDPQAMEIRLRDELRSALASVEKMALPVQDEANHAD
jgi:hypothetical protein